MFFSNTRIVLLGLILLITFQLQASTRPDENLTPGLLCSSIDQDFSHFDYPEQIARCNRSVSKSEKLQVARAYGNIPESEWRYYEFDHMIPLCAGGSNSPKNLWPQPIDEAHNKDGLEDDICSKMRNGQITQKQAVEKVKQWFREYVQ